MTKLEDLKFYADALKSEECMACGGVKKRGYAFCWKCYKQLPRHMQEALFCPIGDGFEEAFNEAMKWLEP